MTRNLPPPSTGRSPRLRGRGHLFLGNAMWKFLPLLLLACSGCASPGSFASVGDTLTAAVAKQGPIIGINRESALNGEVHVLLNRGFVVAVFNADDCLGYWPVTTARIIRVDLNWRALPSAE